MAEFVAIRDGGKTNEEGGSRVLAKLFNQEAVLGDTDWQVTENSPTPDASIDLALGDGIIQNSGFLFHGWATAKVDITIAANASGNPRIDAIVAYIDLAVVSSASNNNPGALKFKNVQGTPAGSPVAPTDGEIQTSVGGSNPFFRLAEIAVADGFSAINDANITDKRTWLAFSSADQSLQYDSITSTWKLTDKLDIATSLTTPIVNVDTVNEKTAANGILVDNLLIKDGGLQRFTDGDNDFIGSGGLWSADDLAVDLDASMTAVVAYIGGLRIISSAVVARTFTVSKDTYIDMGVDGVIDYNEVANAAAAPALAADHIRLAMIITNGTVTTTVFDRRNISPTTIARTELLEGTSDLLRVDNIPSKLFLKISWFFPDTGGTIDARITFNNDTGNNYGHRISANGGADGTQINQAHIDLDTGVSARERFGNAEILNYLASEKMLVGHSVDDNGGGAGVIITRFELNGKWANTAAQITTLTITNFAGAGSYAVGSKIIVSGNN